MGDVKDILGLNKGTASTPAEASASKKEKGRESIKERPKGLSREAFNLLYGQHPIAPCRLLSEVAKKEEPKTTSSAQVPISYLMDPHVHTWFFSVPITQVRAACRLPISSCLSKMRHGTMI